MSADESTPGDAIRARRDATRAAARSGAGFLHFATTRPVAITMIVLATAVFGVVSFTKLPVDLLPEISYPTLTVRTVYPGGAPEDIEDRISERVQEALSTLPHLVRSTSISRAETSDVVLDFDWGTPMTYAVQDVRDKLDGVFLPQGAERPLILRYDPNLDPILRIGISVPENARGGAVNPARGTEGADGPDGGAAQRAHESELVHLRWIAENKIKRELESTPGIAAVQVRGGLQEEIRVRVDPFKMAAQNLDPALLGQRLAQENVNASGGLIREGSTEYLVRTLNEFQDVGEIEDLAVVRRGDAVIRVRDVAVVERSHAEREVVTRIDGREAVEVAIYREAGANIASLADRVLERVFGTEEQQAWAKEHAQDRGESSFDSNASAPQLAYALRNEARFEVLSDQSTFIRDSIADVKDSAIIGGILTIFVIWLALRSMLPTLIIGLSIPISVVVTFAPMFLFGVSLNIMSLGGLALGIGMVVDASIVVLESIMRCSEEGDDLLTASIRGTREVMGAITGSTLTSIAVFVPIVFVHGVAGRIFGDQALTVVTSLLVSLFVAAFFIPMLAARAWLSPAAWTGRAATPPRRLNDGLAFDDQRVRDVVVFAGRALLLVVGWIFRIVAGVLYYCWRALEFVLARSVLRLHDWAWGYVERGYPKLLALALKNAWLVLGVSAALLALSFLRVKDLGLELLPEIHQGEFTVHVGLPVGSSIEYTDQVLGELQRDVRAMPGVRMTAVICGVEKDTLTRDIEGKHTARLTVRLDDEHLAPEPEEKLLQAVRALVARHPAVRSVDVTRPTPFALEAPVQVEVLGYDLEKLRSVGDEVAARLARVQGIADVRTTVKPGHPEARITFDRDKTLEYGLDLSTVSAYVRNQVLGNVSTRFTEGDDRIDVRVLGDQILLDDLDSVLDLVVNPSADTPVLLRDVARVDVVQGPAEIRRIGNSRAVVVSAATTSLDLGGLTERVESALSGLVTPDDVIVQLGGQKREMEEAQGSMRFALLLALFLVYVVMASQFESLLQPLVILVTVPLAFVGVIFTLDLLEIPLSVIVFIGLILLAGIVVANAIVLLDRVNQTRASGMGVYDALIEAGQTRLRPIYMTANTTVIGLLPMTGWFSWVWYVGKLGSGPGAELRAPMAITVVAGLTSSTILTLVIIPCVYYVLYRRRGERSAA